MYFEARKLVLVWMDTTPSIMNTNMVLLRVTPTRMDTKDLQIIDNRDKERASSFYDQYIGAEVVLPDWKDEKLMGKIRKRGIYDDTSKD